MASKRPPYAPWLCYMYLVSFSIFYWFYTLVLDFLHDHPEIEESECFFLYPFFFKVFWFMALWSLLVTTTNDLKVPNKRFKLPKHYLSLYTSARDITERNQVLMDYADEQNLPVFPIRKVLVPGREPVACLGFCSDCLAIKPNRADHCQMCGCCVLLQDHHCAMFCSCINFGNFKAFLCFLAYFCCLSLTVVFTIAPHIGTIWSDTSIRSYSYIAQSVLVTALLGYCSIFSLWVGGLLIFYLIILSVNKTMSDLDRPYISYNLGSTLENWKMVLGRNVLFWPLPVNPVQGDGYVFRCKQIRV